MVKFKPSTRKFYGRHHDLANCYGVYIGITNDHGYVSFVMTYHQVFNKSNTTGVEQELLTFPVVGGYQVLYYVHVFTFIL